MKIVNLVQGSPEWHAHRATHFNASDAPAMLGVSPYKTRAQLVREYATGVTADVDAATQRRFDDGHRFEALARPLAEAIIGEDLYPCVGVADEGRLSASFDGLTMLQDTVFEHKTLNDTLRQIMVDGCTGADLPEMYRVQMEQQSMVSDGARVLFMASKWAGDELAEPERHCWYTPDPELAARIVDGWKLFAEDVAAYQAKEQAALAPTGRALSALPALRIEVTGMITASNLAEWEAAATALFSGINRDLSTDQDFADAELAVKGCRDIESQLEAAKERILSGTESIESTFKTIDRMKEQARATRLALAGLVDARKLARRTDIVERGRQAVLGHYTTINASLGAHALAQPAGLITELGAAIKGKKSFASMEDAIDSAVANLKIAASQQADRVRASMAALEDAQGEYATLFPDRVQLCASKAPDDLRNLAAARIAEHKAKEQKRLDEERERIRAEEFERARSIGVAHAGPVQDIAPPYKVARDKLDFSYGDVYAQDPYMRDATIEERRAKAAAERKPGDREWVTGHGDGFPHVTSSEAVITVGKGGSGGYSFAMPIRAIEDPMTPPATIKLGEVNARIAPLSISADGMSKLGFDPVGTQGAAKLYHERDFGRICAAMAELLAAAAVSGAQ